MNIHNIYNDLDTFSPSQYGSYLLGGAGSKYGKFGHMDSYTEEHRTPEQQDDWGIVQIYDHVNHNMNYYVEDTKSKKFECPEAAGGRAARPRDTGRPSPRSPAAPCR